VVSSNNQFNHSRARSASAAVTPNPPDQRMRSRILSVAGSLWGQIEASISGLLLGGSILLVAYTVLVRYFSPANAPLYTDEITVYLVMWAVLIGCAGITRNRQHVRTDLLLHIMPPSMQFYCELAANLAGTGFALFLAWYGGLVAYEAWDFGDVSPTNLRFPVVDLLLGATCCRRADGTWPPAGCDQSVADQTESRSIGRQCQEV